VILIAYRNLVLTRPAVVKSKNKQLQLDMDIDGFHSVPIEDISNIMVESDGVQISSHALRELAANGTTVFFCDATHLPCGVLLPLSSHSRQLKILQSQLSVKKPLKKRLWQKIIQRKIANQAECLRICNNQQGYKELQVLAKKVQSGDSTFVESQAAFKYFRLLFGNQFRRRNQRTSEDIDIINSALNYGYSIIRGVIARTLVVYGFEPSLGLFHHSETNRFNLADDLLEPFRPLVDLYTYVNVHGDKLMPQHKRNLFGILNYELQSGNENHSVMYSIERLVKSMSSIYQHNEGELILPKLHALKIHTYE
jgi:CRISPR-associated protein Cas1